MFTHISGRYELVDHVASLGQDLLWRSRALWAADRFHPSPPRRVLDVGSGTGELARLAARHYPDAFVVASDFTRAMLAEAVRAAPGEAGARRIDYAAATAARLPFADGTFDLVTNAFVLRNLVDLDAGAREFRRVLRPGGTLLTLEITEPRSALVGRLFHAYFDRVVPALGRAVGSAGPYRYLPESLRSLPPPSEIVRRFGAAGFSRTEAHPQSGGTVTTFLAEAGTAADQRG